MNLKLEKLKNIYENTHQRVVLEVLHQLHPIETIPTVDTLLTDKV